MKLVLAVDVSASVDQTEYTLQVTGLAHALRDPDVRLAIANTGDRGIAVIVTQWSGGNQQSIAIDWTRLSDDSSIDRLADRIAIMPRHFEGGDTRISAAIEHANRLIQTSDFNADGQVIDIAGDGGAENLGLAQNARDRAVASGTTINALAIAKDVLDLDVFFQRNVIGGPGSFVVKATSYEGFDAAMKRKLFREIGGYQISRR